MALASPPRHALHLFHHHAYVRAPTSVKFRVSVPASRDVNVSEPLDEIAARANVFAIVFEFEGVVYECQFSCLRYNWSVNPCYPMALAQVHSSKRGHHGYYGCLCKHTELKSVRKESKQ